MNNRNYYVDKNKVIIKSVFVFLLSFIFVFLLISVISIASSMGGDKAGTDYLRILEYDYSLKNYGDIKETLDYNGLYSEKYNKYIEITDAYEDYLEIRSFGNCEDDSLTPNASKRYCEAVRRLENKYKLLKFDSNKMIVKQWLDNR